MPSVVRVVNLENNKSVVVVVNDRGPFAKGRILDLSKRAAQHLGMIHKGFGNVKIEYLPNETKKLLERMPLYKDKKSVIAFNNMVKSFAAEQNNLEVAERNANS
jgi:rare lipoprotein A